MAAKRGLRDRLSTVTACSARPGPRRRRVAIAFAASSAIFMLATAAPSLAATGSVYFDGNDNAAAGGTLFNGSFTGAGNVGLGPSVMVHLTSGDGDVAIGSGALSSDTEGSSNVATGSSALTLNSTGSHNVATGYLSLFGNSTGNDNVAEGFDALFNASGDNNIALGSGAGQNLTTGSFNIDIGNQGVNAGESKTIRIGTKGNQTRAFIAGISGKTVSGTGTPVVVNSQGQLGTASAVAKVGRSAAAGSVAKLRAQNRRQARQIATLKREVAKLSRR